jgi:hypothetical protein
MPTSIAPTLQSPKIRAPSQGHQDRPRSRVVAQRLGIAERRGAAVTRPHNAVDLVPLVGVTPGKRASIHDFVSSLADLSVPIRNVEISCAVTNSVRRAFASLNARCHLAFYTGAGSSLGILKRPTSALTRSF